MDLGHRVNLIDRKNGNGNFRTTIKDSNSNNSSHTKSNLAEKADVKGNKSTELQ